MSVTSDSLEAPPQRFGVVALHQPRRVLFAVLSGHPHPEPGGSHGHGGGAGDTPPAQSTRVSPPLPQYRR